MTVDRCLRGREWSHPAHPHHRREIDGPQVFCDRVLTLFFVGVARIKTALIQFQIGENASVPFRCCPERFRFLQIQLWKVHRVHIQHANPEFFLHPLGNIGQLHAAGFAVRLMGGECRYDESNLVPQRVWFARRVPRGSGTEKGAPDEELAAIEWEVSFHWDFSSVGSQICCLEVPFRITGLDAMALCA